MPIFDQGYQHWQGELAGHGWRWLAITRHGVRIGLKNRFLQLLLLAALGPALMLAGGISIWGLVEQKTPWAMGFLGGIRSLRGLVADPTAYRVTAWTLFFHFFLMIQIWFIMILVLLVGPSLISKDLRFNALPLYFSRPVRRIDYFVGKLGVIGFFLGMVTVVPAVLAWALGLLFSLDFRAVIDTFRLLMGLVLFGVIVSVSAGLFILALSSMSRNSRYVAAFWGGMWLLTGLVSLILDEINQESMRRQSYMVGFKAEEKTRQMLQLQQMLQQFENLPPGNPKEFDGPDKLDMKKHREQPAPVDDPRNPEEKIKSRKQMEQELLRLIKERQQLIEESKKNAEEMDEQRREDWRPVISYTANLQRIGFALIGSQEAWEVVDQLDPTRNPLNMNQPGWAAAMVPKYPWYWSALVLLGVAALSLWILHRRVTSLDQLK
jgi:ABC-type transport system involved in multi-copper enzyme maturation permease subunit